jgi:hypothetical protein
MENIQNAIRDTQNLGKTVTDAGSKFSNAQTGAHKLSQEILEPLSFSQYMTDSNNLLTPLLIVPHNILQFAFS